MFAKEVLPERVAELEASLHQATVFYQTLTELTKNKDIYRHDLKAALEIITEIAGQALETQRTSVWLYTADLTGLRCLDLYDMKAAGHSEGTVLEAKSYPAYFKALEKEEVIAAHDAHTDPATSEFSAAYLSPLNITSMLDVPLRLAGRVAGALCHEHVGPKREWTLAEQNFVSALASLISMVIEAHERKQTETLLRQANLVMESSPVVLFRWRAAENWPVEFVSNNISSVLGYTPGELLSGATPFATIVHPDDLERVVQEVQAYSAGGVDRFQQEYRLMTRGGDVCWIDDRTVIERNSEGQITHYQGLVIDITDRKLAEAERERLQQEVISAQQRAIKELSTPVIPIMDRIIVMPLIGSIDTLRAREITRTLLAGIREHRAKVVILDITGVPLVDSGVANYLNKTIQAARLKGARTIITGVSDAVAETIVDLGLDWGKVETLADLQTGLMSALSSLGLRINKA